MRLLKNFYITIFLYFFSFTSGFSQCGSFNIVANKTSACAPQVVKYYVNNAPDGTLFEWEIAGNTFFGGDTVYQTHIHPATFKPRVTLTLPDGSICNLSDQSLIVEIHEDQVFGVNSQGDTSYSNVVCIFGDPQMLIPNAFSPNGDGVNDVFIPHSKYFNDGTILGDYTFSIFNRWGE